MLSRAYHGDPQTHGFVLSDYTLLPQDMGDTIEYVPMSPLPARAHSGRKIAYTSTAEMSICGYVTYSLVRTFFTLEYLVRCWGLIDLSYSRRRSVLEMFVFELESCCLVTVSHAWLHDSWLLRCWAGYSDTGLIIQTLGWLFRHWADYSDTGLYRHTFRTYRHVTAC